MIHFPPRRILVAFDRSPIAAKALQHARALASRFSAELEAVYVEPFQPAYAGMPPVPGLTPAATHDLRVAIGRAVGAGVHVTVSEGDPASRILAAARARRPDLIVVGTHGRAGAARVLLGSVAEAVIGASPVPVLVARGPVQPFENLLAPVHFTSYSDKAFAYAAQAARAFDARLTAIHVTSDPVWEGAALMRLRRLAESLPAAESARCEVRVVPGEDVCAGILKAAEKADLIVLSSHSRARLRDAVFGTTAEKVLRHAKVSILVVPTR